MTREGQQMAAKTVISVRVDPNTLARIDETAKKLGTTRGQLISETLDAGFATEFGPLELVKAIADNRVSTLVSYMNDLQNEAVEQAEKLSPEDRAKVKDAISEG